MCDGDCCQIINSPTKNLSTMTSHKESHDAIDFYKDEKNSPRPDRDKGKDNFDLPPSGTSLHKRRRGEAPASISVKSPQTPDTEGSSPCTAAPNTTEFWDGHNNETDAVSLCNNMIQRLKDRSDLPSKFTLETAIKTKENIEILDQLEKLMNLLNQFINLKGKKDRLARKLKDINHLKNLHNAFKKIEKENEIIKNEIKEIEWMNEAIDAEAESEYEQAIFDSIIGNTKSMKRSGSKWKSHGRFGGSLLRKQRSRSAGGDDSDCPLGSPHRRGSEGIFNKEVEKSKVSKWTKVKSAFRWEKAQCLTSNLGGAAAVAAGAMVGAVALAGSSPSPGLSNPEPRDSASLTPGSAFSLTPNSSCEELRMDSGCRKSGLLRCDENDNTFLHAPTQDDSSTSTSPNKLHKSPWGKMKGIISTHRDSVKKKSRGSKSSSDVVPSRRRSLSDGGDSDAPPALTLTIPSSEELESDPHPILRKQRSLELNARPPQHRTPRPSKWTKVKKAFLSSTSTSMPSSPNRHSAFFTDAETEGLSSGCEASAVATREEVVRDYVVLQSRLCQEFSDRREKWHPTSRPVATEEQLSADFRKKLQEWQRKKGVKQPPPAPDRKDLSEDFLKKWDEWKRMKETNSVPAWEQEAKPDEVLVQTSTGLYKFKGISRSFTRKLHEWEKSRGIAPEASTSALLQAARARGKAPPAPLTRAQSDGSVAPSAGSGRLHASSLSVNDVDAFESDYDREHSPEEPENTRAAILVEVEAEEVCTAALLVAVSPRHTPQKPVYTYGRAEARLLCETSSAVTGTAVLQPVGGGIQCVKSKEQTVSTLKIKDTREQSKSTEKTNRRKLGRQPSIEEDAMFIRKTIEEIERGSSSRLKDQSDDIEYSDKPEHDKAEEVQLDKETPSTSKGLYRMSSKQSDSIKEEDDTNDSKRKENEKNGKKKSKSRARLEREQSKPSESDTEQDVDTVTVEIPRRRKRPRKQSEKPKTPPTSLHSDSEEEVFVLKLKAPELRSGSPEVIVKTTRKIFSPVVRSGETSPRAVIPVDVEDLDEVRPLQTHKSVKKHSSEGKTKRDDLKKRSKSSGDLQENEEQKMRSRPPLPLSPSSQRKPQPKETAPSIRIMIQRYNMKINEEGHTSGASSGASSPAWRSPSTERRRPPDMPVGVNIRNNPFLEREVQKSASACQLSRRDQTSAEKRLIPSTPQGLDGVLKSYSANALHPEKTKAESPRTEKKIREEGSDETIKYPNASTDTIIPDLTRNLPDFHTQVSVPNFPSRRQFSDAMLPMTSAFVQEFSGVFERSVSSVEPSISSMEADGVEKLTERTARIRAARERFLSSPVQMRREGTSSASDLRPGDRLSKISCESDVTETQSTHVQETNLGRSASTGMVNVDKDAWQRVTEGGRRESRRSKFSLARLAARLRRKDDGAVSRLCRQSLLVQLRKQ